MLKRSILSLFLLVSFGSMHAMTILHDIDASLLGQPQHHVTVLEGNYRTVYAAYPKEALATLEQRKLFTQCASALSTTSLLYMGFKAISNAFANSWNYIATASTRITPRHVTTYILLSGLSYGLARHSWNAYDNVIKLYQRMMTHNTNNSLFASDIPATTLPANNLEITAINAQNSNLIWIRTSHARITPPARTATPLVASAPPFDSDAQYQQMYPNVNAPRTTIPAAPHATAKSTTESTALECVVCLQHINKRDTAANIALPCGHVFHVPCITPITNNPSGKCPLCQVPVRQ